MREFEIGKGYIRVIISLRASCFYESLMLATFLDCLIIDYEIFYA